MSERLKEHKNAPTFRNPPKPPKAMSKKLTAEENVYEYWWEYKYAYLPNGKRIELKKPQFEMKRVCNE